MDSLIAIDNLSRRYGVRFAVKDLCFSLGSGEILGLLGPNGAGKTTTMQMITGNLSPTIGEIRINGVDLVEHPKQAKSSLGYLPEHPPLYADLRVDEYLRYCARLRGIPRSRIKEAVETAKDRCGLSDIGRRLTGHLSKGYRQRVGIAQAIIHDPAVLILDEPTTGLDPKQIAEIRALIAELGETKAVILSTHILREVQSLCTRVLILHMGRIVFTGIPETRTIADSGGSLQVTLDRPPDLPALAALPGVRSVEPHDGGGFRLHLDDDTTVSSLAEKIVLAGWGLSACVPEQPSLEQIFVDLTTGEDAA